MCPTALVAFCLAIFFGKRAALSRKCVTKKFLLLTCIDLTAMLLGCWGSFFQIATKKKVCDVGCVKNLASYGVVCPSSGVGIGPGTCLICFSPRIIRGQLGLLIEVLLHMAGC